MCLRFVRWKFILSLSSVCFICYLTCWSTGQRGAASLAERYPGCCCVFPLLWLSFYFFCFLCLLVYILKPQACLLQPSDCTSFSFVWSLSEFSQLMTSSLSGTGLMNQQQLQSSPRVHVQHCHTISPKFWVNASPTC